MLYSSQGRRGVVDEIGRGMTRSSVNCVGL